MKTKKEVRVKTMFSGLNQIFVVPKGTRVVKVGNYYAVASIRDTIACGMNEHDAIHHFLFIPEQAVDKTN